MKNKNLYIIMIIASVNFCISVYGMENQGGNGAGGIPVAHPAPSEDNKHPDGKAITLCDRTREIGKGTYTVMSNMWALGVEFVKATPWLSSAVVSGVRLAKTKGYDLYFKQCYGNTIRFIDPRDIDYQENTISLFQNVEDESLVVTTEEGFKIPIPAWVDDYYCEKKKIKTIVEAKKQIATLPLCVVLQLINDVEDKKELFKEVKGLDGGEQQQERDKSAVLLIESFVLSQHFPRETIGKFTMPEIVWVLKLASDLGVTSPVRQVLVLLASDYLAMQPSTDSKRFCGAIARVVDKDLSESIDRLYAVKLLSTIKE